MLQIAIDRLRNPDKGKGSDVLLIAVLNAYMSSTFRPTGANDSDTRVQDMVEEMREIAIKSEKAERSSLSEVVEDTLDNILAKKKSNDDTL